MAETKVSPTTIDKVLYYLFKSVNNMYKLACIKYHLSTLTSERLGPYLPQEGEVLND